jgi:type IV pilus assembly protein PilY1
MMNNSKWMVTALIALTGFVAGQSAYAEPEVNISQDPLFLTGANAPPLNMLVMGRDHTLYYEAYNDASDLNGDGVLNVGYEPEKVDYYGYFDSFLCYSYSDERFSPSGEAGANKTCSSGWSGDFLNYITTSRIDALRKVLYGGMRVVDTESMTVLERAYIPQDAHSWGKEYRSIEHDGYDIRDYTPLDLPASGTRHLIANTTLLKNDVLAPNRSMDMAPLMRVLTNSNYRIWEWVAIERHVAGSRCIHGGNNSNPCVVAGGTQTFDHPDSHSEFSQLIDRITGEPAQFCGVGTEDPIDTEGSNNNPFTGPAHCEHDNYLTIIDGHIRATQSGTHAYEFATNGDDAVELIIEGTPISWWYGGHGREGGDPDEIAEDIRDNDDAFIGSFEMTGGQFYTFSFHHEEGGGGDNYQLLWRRKTGDDTWTDWEIVPAGNLRGIDNPEVNLAPRIRTWSTELTVPASNMNDYVVRVEVCDEDFLSDNCQEYPGDNDPVYKPVGLLHQFGENNSMLFGLLTGSFTHPYNTRGGVLRKNIDSFRDEVNSTTGQFTDVDGIVATLDKFRIVDFDMGGNYQYDGGWLTSAPMAGSSSQFPDWGNPIAEMMFEAVRYYAGGEEGRAEFMPGLINGKERVNLEHYIGTSYMDLPVAEWDDPFTRDSGDALYCSPAAQLVISDVNPNYDTQYLPGSHWNAGFSDDLTELDVSAEASTIWSEEFGGTRLHFIGETETVSDSAPTPKEVSSFNIRGLSPSEPTKQGGYYAASVARYAFLNDLRDELDGKQHIHTFSVALASPLPRIEIPVGDNIVTVVPYAMSTGQGGSDWTDGDFMPTNTIVDFFIETFANTDPGGSDFDATVNDGLPFIRFRINYEDVEQGADHDMDAIVLYELRANDDGTLTITLDSQYAAGGITHNMGYVISGTTADGVYLEVRDIDGNSYTADAATPPGVAPGGCGVGDPPDACDDPLPLLASRTFEVGGDSAATVLQDPLWFAAKYGSDQDEDMQPGDDPSNYFLVTNATNLAAQLTQAFQRILALADATSIATESSRVREGAFLYRAEFDTEGWSGNVTALNPFTLEEVWSATDGTTINEPGSRDIYTWEPDFGARAFDTSIPVSSEIRTRLLPAGHTLPVGLETDVLIEYIRGDYTAGEPFLRERESRIGDIINSRLRFSGPVNEGWARLPEDAGGGVNDSGTYGRYIDCDKQDDRVDGFELPDIDGCTAGRNNTVFVGSNNGLLHAFDAENGEELFAYLPAGVQENLWRLADPDYDTGHQFYVDGQFEIRDAFDGSEWRTVLIGGLGAGGKGVFALDVTTPQSFEASDVLWEIGPDDDSRIGHVFGRPRVTRLEDGTWVVVFGNGADSADNSGSLVVVDLFDGDILQVVETPDATVGEGDNEERVASGLSSPAIWSALSGLYAERIYAGDVFGRMWRFPIESSSVQAPQLLFEDPDNNSITVTPTTARDIAGGVYVFFGTGQLFEEGDNVISAVDEPVQHFYGLLDKGTQITRDSLTERSLVLDEGLRTVDASDSLGTTGWFLPLEVGGNAKGERVLNSANVSFGRLLFRTYEPNEDPCLGGGIIRDYPLDAISGAIASGPGGSLKIIERGGPPSGGSDFVIWEPPIGGDPGDPEDPEFPGSDDEGDPPDVPDDLTGDPEGWCPEFGFVDLDGNFTPLGTICDGRQVWRQVR